MKIGELRKILKSLDADNSEIFLSIDSEGNAFCPVDEVAFTDKSKKAVIIWPSDNFGHDPFGGDFND